MTPLDVAVAGCGPAGMAAALLLARHGHRVTIYEQFSRPGPVGSGLMIQPTGLAVLDRLGLADHVRIRGAAIHRLHGKAQPSGRTALEVRFDWLKQPGSWGYGIHRAALFGILHEALEAENVPVEPNWAVAGTRPEGARLKLTRDGGEASPAFDLVINAMGAMSPLSTGAPRPLAYGALWATLGACPGFAPDVLEQRYHRASRMCGVLPIGGGKVAFFWSLRQDQLESWRSRGLEAWKQEVRALWPATDPLLEQIEAPAQLTFARYAHRTLRRPVQGPLIHIGDAWHSTSPQLGQGANMALLDAWALASALSRSNRLETGLAAAIRLRHRHIRLYQGLSRLFTPAYQSDGRMLPAIRDALVPLLARIWPATLMQAQMVAGTFGKPLERLGLRP